MDEVRTPVEGLVDAGAEPVFALYLGNQVDGELTIGSLNSAHYTGDFVYTNLESTSHRQVNLDGLKLDAAAVGTTPYVIIDSGTSLFAGPITDVKSIAASLSSSNTISSSEEYTFYCTAMYNVAYTAGGVNYELFEKDLVISTSGGTCHFGVTAFDVPAPHGPLCVLHHEARHCRRQFCHHEVRHCQRNEECLPCGCRVSRLWAQACRIPLSCAFPPLPMPGFSHLDFSLASRVVRNSVLVMAPCESRVSRWRAHDCHCVVGLNIHVPRQCVMLSFCSLVLCASPGCPACA